MRIFLVGFMGSGKTHWGRIWADRLGLTFYDLDEVFVETKNESIIDFFDKHGEREFRREESVLLKTFDQKDDYILACGGGTPCYFDNMQWMKSHGTTIYLHATAQQLFDRVITEKEHRPLIQDLPDEMLLGFIKAKLQERKGLYMQSEIMLEEAKEDSLDSLVKTKQNA
jgi:shikimate kinase